MRNSDKRFLRCKQGHRINAITVAIALSTDDDETPIRLLPPLHCRPIYWRAVTEAERLAALRVDDVLEETA